MSLLLRYVSQFKKPKQFAQVMYNASIRSRRRSGYAFQADSSKITWILLTQAFKYNENIKIF